MIRRTFLIALATLASLGFARESAAATKIFMVHKGSQELVAYGTISNPETTDRLIFILMGSGSVKLTVGDADATGDTVSVSGTMSSAQSSSFTATATSPNVVTQTLLTNNLGVLSIDVGFSQVVNGLPARYYYQLQF